MFIIENSTREQPSRIKCSCDSTERLQVVLHHDYLEILCHECKAIASIPTMKLGGDLWNCCCGSENPPICK